MPAKTENPAVMEDSRIEELKSGKLPFDEGAEALSDLMHKNVFSREGIITKSKMTEQIDETFKHILRSEGEALAILKAMTHNSSLVRTDLLTRCSSEMMHSTIQALCLQEVIRSLHDRRLAETEFSKLEEPYTLIAVYGASASVCNDALSPYNGVKESICAIVSNIDKNIEDAADMFADAYRHLEGKPISASEYKRMAGRLKGMVSRQLFNNALGARAYCLATMDE